MKTSFIFFFSFFLMGHIATAQFHNTTIDYTLDTDCSTDISEAGSTVAFKIEIDHNHGGWQGGEGTAWLNKVKMSYVLEFTNTTTGQVDFTSTTNLNLPSNGTTLTIDEGLLYGNLEDGEYTVRLFVKAKRIGNSTTGVNFKIDDITSGQSSQNVLQSNNSFVELNTDVIFCFEYQKCDDFTVDIVAVGSYYYASVYSPNSPVFSLVWVITDLQGYQQFIPDVYMIPAPIECSSVGLIITDGITGCEYSYTIPCPIALCQLPAPANIFYQTMGTGQTTIAWDEVEGASHYKVIRVNNAAECCDGNDGPQAPMISYTENNYITIPTIQKYSCFSLQIIPLCEGGGIGQASDIECFRLPNPFRPVGNEVVKRMSSQKESMVVYPNPASQQVQLALTGEIGTTSNITILDAKGSIVMNRNITFNADQNVITWDLANVDSGIYIIRAINGSEVRTEKLMVTK